jgi:hypothetical protein
MTLKADLESEVKEIFASTWKEREGRVAFRYRFFRKGGEKGAARPRDLLR